MFREVRCWAQGHTASKGMDELGFAPSAWLQSTLSSSAGLCLPGNAQ